MRQLLLTASILLATAATAPAVAQDAPASAQAAAPAPAEAQPVAAPAAIPTPAQAQPEAAGRVGAPPESKGQVVFFRPSGGGMLLSFSVHEGDKGVGKLTNASYFVLPADPGVHTYTIQSEAKDSLTLEVEAGETYYVKNTIGMGLVVGRPHLAPATKEQFDKAKVKLSTKQASDLKPTS
jgi:hypothetical protein